MTAIKRFNPTTYLLSRSAQIPLDGYVGRVRWDSAGNYYLIDDFSEPYEEWGGMHSQAGIAKYSGQQRLWWFYLSEYWHEYYSQSSVDDAAIDSNQNVFLIITYMYNDSLGGTTYSGTQIIKLNSDGTQQWEQHEESSGINDATKCIAVSGNGFCAAKWLNGESIVAFSPDGAALCSVDGYGV